MADLNILVFTCRGSTDSVVVELIHAIDNQWLHKCKVFEEISNGVPSMGTLIRDSLKIERYTITQVEKENDTDLYEHVSGDVYCFFDKFIRNL